MIDFKVSWFDRFLMSVAPTWGLNRVKSRAKTSIALRSYDAAGTGRRTSGWHRNATDANAAAGPSIAALRELSRDLRRNNGWAKRAIQVISGNTVGWGIMAKPATKKPDLAKRAGEIWKDWSERIDCDYDGRMPFTGLQRLVMDTVVESGEAIILRETANADDGLPVPMRIRVLEPDYLDITRTGKGEGGKIISGIEFDGRGRRVAYWLYEQHPGATGGFGASFLKGTHSRRVPASDVLHVYQVDRPGQLRGVPWLAAAVAKLNDFDDYDDARLMQAKVAACFGAFVSDLEGAPALGEQDTADDNLEELQPGQIQYLTPGKSITFPNPPSVSDHGAFSETQLRRIAASLGVTYEDLTTDYSRVNFSSARMARLSHWQTLHGIRWEMLIPQFCDGVWGWVMEYAAGIEGWTEVPRAEWSPPPMPMISPEKEGLAYQRLIRSGTMTLYQAIREQGNDPATHLAEIAEGNKALDAAGIVLDSDARKTSGAGLAQMEAAASGTPPAK